MLKPSIKDIVTEHIFFEKFDENKIFKRNKTEIYRLLKRVSPINFTPEENVINQDEEGECFYLIVSGQCRVSVKKF